MKSGFGPPVVTFGTTEQSKLHLLRPVDTSLNQNLASASNVPVPGEIWRIDTTLVPGVAERKPSTGKVESELWTCIFFMLLWSDLVE